MRYSGRGSDTVRNEKGDDMGIDLLFKIAAVGIIVAILNLILKKTDHDEQIVMLNVAGIIIVLMMIIPALEELFNTVRNVFGLW